MEQIKFEGRAVYFEVSPCSWMNVGYGLQVKISSKEKPACNAESIFINDKTVSGISEMPEETRDEYARHAVIEYLKANGIAPLDAAVTNWAAAQAKYAEEDKKIAAREVQEAAKRKAEGYTHKVELWIHPRNGSDYQRAYFVKGEPSKTWIAGKLRLSVRKDDFSVTAI